MSIDFNRHDVFVLRQILRMAVNRYEFSLPERPDEPVLFVEQKLFKLKEDIRFYSGGPGGELVMRLKARQVFDPRAKYAITDARRARSSARSRRTSGQASCARPIICSTQAAGKPRPSPSKAQ